MQVIIVSGTPGTGKTTIAKRLARQKGFKYVDVNALIRKFHLAEGYDKEMKAKISGRCKDLRQESRKRGCRCSSPHGPP